ncbi:carboxyl-terminal processing protease [Tangfeifania diversioriginum]|uniref:Carboxyl-terminal processing protease n=1 Tax=Tangfeifania diversioriginum TaxID=1168035 RepID=A0A1M6BS49_9BACT|nr:S41 family peptidase [Tangfeifania diversioriginum]SHI51318.1 carboxyl-terminal processing protease [Tangfeifania diversioriginum]
MTYHRNIKKWRQNLLLLISLFVLAPAFLSAQESVQKNQLKFGRLLRLVDSYYVDTTNVDELTENSIVHLLSELDPHSVYISKEEVQRMNEPLQGNFEGIGISFNIFKDTLLVTTTIPGGPSEKVGVRAGDRIVEVDGENIAGTGIKNSDVFDLLRGKKGTKVEIKVVRKSSDKMLEFKIIRDKIPINSLDASYMLDESTGYIKLNKFSATTTDEFTEAMNQLNQQNIENLVLDLRGNGGGYLKTAIEISDQFLENNKLVVYTEGTNEPKREYNATTSGIFENGNLIVLVDESSASASEIVSGAVQDWDRGLVIGRRSFGKGLVQKPYFLTDGSVVRLTTAHYYTPSGRCIQKPYDNGTEDYRRDRFERMAAGEFFSKDSIDLVDSLKYKTLVNGRTVYGGGGVMPDIFVPMDTSSYFRYYNRLRRNQIVYNFVLDYVDKNRSKLKRKYAEFDGFNTNFEVTEDMVNTIVANGEKEGIEKDQKSLDFTRVNMKREIKALIARDIFARDDFYKIINEDDDAIRKALEVIKNQEQYNNLLVSTE